MRGSAIFTPPSYPSGFVDALGLEGTFISGGDHGVKVLEGLEEVQCGYKRVTSDKAWSPVSSLLCSRGWVMGRSHFHPRRCVVVVDLMVVESGGEGLCPGLAVFGVGYIARGRWGWGKGYGC